MTDLENNGQEMDLTELEVMEPKMMIHDDLKVIYINEALEEALTDENSEEKKKYDAEGELYEVSSFFAFKNMFLARYPECRNIYKVEKKIKEFEERQKNKE